MTTVEPGTKCGWCGGEIYPLAGQKGYAFADGSVGMEEGWVHADWRHCLSTALARATTAEHQLGEVREGLADAHRVAAVERERVRALEQRVAELNSARPASSTGRSIIGTCVMRMWKSGSPCRARSR